MRRFVPAYAASPDHDAPIASLNITPLIDVLLVLLVMMILTLPTPTHEVPMDLPQPMPDAAKPRAVHRLELARDGEVSLDGAAMGDAMLAARLGRLRDDPQSMLMMRTDPETRYERFDQTLALVKRAGVTRMGFEGDGGTAW